MGIIKKLLIVIIALALLLFVVYNVWIVNNEENKIYIKDTKEELKNFENELIQNIDKESSETEDHNEAKNNEPIKETESNEDTNKSNNNNESAIVVNNDNNNQVEIVDNNTKTKKKLLDIKDTYNEAFSNLEVKANQLLENLISQAIEEYSNLTSEEKKSETALASMAIDYLNRANELENQIDEIFYSLLSKMENELIENDLDKNIITQYEDEYITRKKARKKELMNKALNIQHN